MYPWTPHIPVFISQMLVLRVHTIPNYDVTVLTEMCQLDKAKETFYDIVSTEQLFEELPFSHSSWETF